MSPTMKLLPPLPRFSRLWSLFFWPALGGAVVSCSRGEGKTQAHQPPPAAADRVITVYNAGSLAAPLRVALDTFAAKNQLRVEQENGGSLEIARKLTELGKIPDVIALADAEVFPKLLVPKYVAHYTPFARNRMVLAYTNRSRFAGTISADNWTTILTRPDVETGRSDPNTDPAGYRTLLLFQLAERFYSKPGLAVRLETSAPLRNVRPKSADLVALLQAGNLDYAWGYESVARGAGLRYLTLPPTIDLSTPADSLVYATASVRVRGASPGDTVVMHGLPIVYGIATPLMPPHGDVGQRFITFLMSPRGRALLAAKHLDLLDSGRPADNK
jgi:molybdate/tungstate transport system substrate-binding protein